jgi:hypothetical protein
MKNLFYIIFLLAILQTGCTEEEVLDFKQNPDPLLLELNEILSGELHSVEDSLKSLYLYKDEQDRYIGRSDYYYDGSGYRILSVGISPDNDTTGISVYKNNPMGLLIEDIWFRKIQNVYQWNSTRSYERDNSGKITHQYSETFNMPKKLLSTYFYNESGLLVERYFPATPPDRYLYDYDEHKRPVMFRWVVGQEEDYPLQEYHYQYNEENLLIAKITRRGVPEGEPMMPAFVYSYNDRRQLVEETAYDPLMGFPKSFKTVFEYYPGKGVSEN